MSTRTTTHDRSPADERPSGELPRAELWLADGYNLLHCAPFRAPGGDATTGAGPRPFWSAPMREQLVEVARGFTHPHRALWLVFDGPRENTQRIASESCTDGDHDDREHQEDPDKRKDERSAAAPRGELHLSFAPSADDWIVRRVKEVHGAAELGGRDPLGVGCMTSVAVVSGDRRLGNRARHHGAAVVSPRLFLAHCGVGGERRPGGERGPG